MYLVHLTKMLSGGGGICTSRLSEALRLSGLKSRMLSLNDGCKCFINEVGALVKAGEQYQAWAKRIQQLSASIFSQQLIQSQFKQLIEKA